MGYDMRLENPGELSEKESYFAAYGDAMPRLLYMMRMSGMTFKDTRPKFPQAKHYGCSWMDVNAVRYPDDADYDEHRELLTPERLEKVEAFLEALGDYQAFHGNKDVPTIPLHKLCTNDNWLVTESECEAALTVWKSVKGTFPPQSMDDLIDRYVVDLETWRKWLEFIKRATTHGGFRVG